MMLNAQGEGDLGSRMLRAPQRALKSNRNVLGGADAPALGKKEWKAAEAALDAHDIVLIPADDGGYG